MIVQMPIVPLHYWQDIKLKHCSNIVEKRKHCTGRNTADLLVASSTEAQISSSTSNAILHRYY